MKRVAVIGAGISGLVVAHKLSQEADVVIFEKARGVGGRMSTRYADPFYFDHGAQFFTARSQEFNDFLKPYIEKKIISPWKGKVISLESDKKESDRIWFEPHFVASPKMNSLCKEMSDGLNVVKSCEIAPLSSKIPEGWEIKDKDGNSHGYFDFVISTAPSEQTVRLFGSHLQEDNPISQIKMLGCYAVMIGFNKPWDKKWIAAKVNNNPIDWISVDSTKPGRNNDLTSLVIHASNDWSENYIDHDIEEIQNLLLGYFSELTGIETKNADYVSTHRWRYAKVQNPNNIGSYIDTKVSIAAIGDWCNISRIEDVWLEANSLAEKILKEF